MDPLLFAVLAVSVTVGALTFYVGGGVVKANQNTGARLSSLQTRDTVLEQDFSERAVAPVMQGLGRFALRFTPTGWVDKSQRKLVLAGRAERMDGNSWAAIRIITLAVAWSIAVAGIVTLVIGVVAAFFVVPMVDSSFMKLAVGGMAVVLGFYGPEASLNRSIDDRRKKMERHDLFDR